MQIICSAFLCLLLITDCLIAQQSRKTVAVLNLVNAGGVDNNEISILTDRFTSALFNTNTFKVLERDKMNEILKAQDFNMSDNCNSTECAVQVGQLLGVEIMVAGKVGKFGQTYTVDLRMMDIVTGELLKTGAENYKGDKEGLLDVIESMAYKLAGISISEKAPSEISTLTKLANNMVFIKGGIYEMGDIFGEGWPQDRLPVHRVRINDFYISKYEITQKEWREVMGTNPSYFKDCDECAVETVSWYDVIEFIKKLNTRTGKNYRLPSEAEWEYAARSGGLKDKSDETKKESDIDPIAWFDKNSAGRTHPVGMKQPNSIGLYDMKGNVWEWCQDWYNENYYSQSSSDNPKGPITGTSRVLRGGSWDTFNTDFLSYLHRNSSNPGFRNSEIGFRIVIE